MFLFCGFRNMSNKCHLLFLCICAYNSNPQAPWDPSPEQDHVRVVLLVLVSPLLDQLAPQLRPFEIADLTCCSCLWFFDQILSRDHHHNSGSLIFLGLHNIIVSSVFLNGARSSLRSGIRTKVWPPYGRPVGDPS